MQEDVASHIKKCPAVKQLDRFEHQLYHSKGINAGSDDDDDDADEKSCLIDVSSGSNERTFPVKVRLKLLERWHLLVYSSQEWYEWLKEVPMYTLFRLDNIYTDHSIDGISPWCSHKDWRMVLL